MEVYEHRGSRRFERSKQQSGSTDTVGAGSVSLNAPLSSIANLQLTVRKGNENVHASQLAAWFHHLANFIRVLLFTSMRAGRQRSISPPG
jgi:hypothetical protein